MKCYRVREDRNFSNVNAGALWFDRREAYRGEDVANMPDLVRIFPAVAAYKPIEIPRWLVEEVECPPHLIQRPSRG